VEKGEGVKVMEEGRRGFVPCLTVDIKMGEIR